MIPEFSDNRSDPDGPTDRRTDGPTDRGTEGPMADRGGGTVEWITDRLGSTPARPGPRVV
jgi:hypothetical protein